MSTSFSNYLLFFCLKSEKMQYLHCVVEFQLRKLSCTLTWYENAVPQLRCASTESKSSLRKLRCASEIKKINMCILRCALICYLCPPSLYTGGGGVQKCSPYPTPKPKITKFGMRVGIDLNVLVVSSS